MLFWIQYLSHFSYYCRANSDAKNILVSIKGKNLWIIHNILKDFIPLHPDILIPLNVMVSNSTNINCFSQ